jgi:UDP-3-O-[3-hydroxymyristoyl] glucosamine N-acyltransferase
LGNVVVEDDVEIGANSTVDRSTMGSTIIHTGVKLDNLVHIAHNVEVGANTVMAAMTGIAGSTRIGEHCTFGGQSGVAGHIAIADHTTVAAQTGVIATVRKPGTTLVGYPALDYGTYMRAYAKFRSSGRDDKKKEG